MRWRLSTKSTTVMLDGASCTSRTSIGTAAWATEPQPSISTRAGRWVPTRERSIVTNGDVTCESDLPQQVWRASSATMLQTRFLKESRWLASHRSHLCGRCTHHASPQPGCPLAGCSLRCSCVHLLWVVTNFVLKAISCQYRSSTIARNAVSGYCLTCQPILTHESVSRDKVRQGDCQPRK